MKCYVKVQADFDATGFLQPASITWSDGRVFPIERIKSFERQNQTNDCFTVQIYGKEVRLYFERTDPMFHSRIGRWFVYPRDYKNQEELI